MGIPQGNPLPCASAIWAFITSPSVSFSASSHQLSTSILSMHLYHTWLSLHLHLHPSISHALCYSLMHPNPPYFHFRLWQSYHYPATHLCAACYFSFALRGLRDKPLPRTLDPSHRFYPREVWQVCSTLPGPPVLHVPFISFSLSSFSIGFLSIGCLRSMAAYANKGPSFQRAVYP